MQDTALKQWYNLSPDEALHALQSRRAGLTEAVANERRLRYGANELKGKKWQPFRR